MQKTSKLYAIAHAKCPRCRRGNMFSGPTYGFKLQITNERCPKCQLKFEVEPGYYYAAMYVSYALNVAEMVSLGVLTYLFTGRLDMEATWLYVGVLLGGVLLLSPFNFRYSRVLLLHWLSPKVHYDPSLDKE